MIEHSDKNKFKTTMKLFMYHVDFFSCSNSFQECTDRSYDRGIFYAVLHVVYFTFNELCPDEMSQFRFIKTF